MMQNEIAKPGAKKSSVGKNKKGHGRLSTVAFILVCGIPIVANLAFGGMSSGVFAAIIAITALLPIVWLAHVLTRKELRISSEPAQLALLGLILLGLFQLLPLASHGIPGGVLNIAPSATLTLDPNATRFAVIRLFVFGIYFAGALVFLDSPGRLKKASVTLIVFGSLMSFFAVLQFLSDPGMIYGMTPSAMARPFGTYVNQHHFASFLVMILGLTLGLLTGGAVKRDKIIFLLIAAVILGTGVIFTGSRGAFLSMISVLAFMAVAVLLLRRRSASRNSDGGKVPFLKSAAAVGAAAVGLVILVFIVALWAGGEQGLIRGAGMQEAGPDFSTGRLLFWTVALKIFTANPIIGTGLDSFGVAFTRYDPMNGLYRVEEAHNDYLQILADGGIVGFLIVAAFIFFLFRGALRVINNTHDRMRRSIAVGALAGCFGVLIHSFVDFPLRTNANAYFFLLLAALALVSVKSGKQVLAKT